MGKCPFLPSLHHPTCVEMARNVKSGMGIGGLPMCCAPCKMRWVKTG